MGTQIVVGLQGWQGLGNLAVREFIAQASVHVAKFATRGQVPEPFPIPKFPTLESVPELMTYFRNRGWTVVIQEIDGDLYMLFD